MAIKGGELIKRARNIRGFTQIDLAEQYGIHRTTLNKWEIGKSEPSFLQVGEICEMFGLELDEVYSYVADDNYTTNTRRTKKVG